MRLTLLFSGGTAPGYSVVMHCFQRTLLAAALTCLSALAMARPDDEPLRVLVITDFYQRSGPFETIANAFSNELLQREPRPIVMRYVDLSVRDEPSVSNESLDRLLLERMYAPEPPDLVLALGPPAVEFWQRNRGEAFRDVPLLACAAEVGGIDPEFIARHWAVISRYSFDGQVAEIRQLLPDTRHIFMIFGASARERTLARVAAEQSQDEFDDIELEFSTDMTFDQMIDRVSQLGEGSVVYYVTPDTDAAGELVGDEDGLARIRAASGVPVFGPFDNQMGRGIVGGSLIQLEKIGRTLGKHADGILDGIEVPKGVHYVDLSPPSYDWRELKAWEIPLDRLPPEGETLFRPPGPMELYRGWIFAIALLIAAQAWLIVQWWIQRRGSRRNAAENIDLSTRLISAHEDERRLIARELHDDLSQRLARLSIDASQVASAIRGEKSTEIMHGMKQELLQLGKDVHDLSYRLHPSLLDDLGLANALRAECDRLRRHTAMSIVYKIDDVEPGLPIPTQLHIYRIAQEALQNAVRHSVADTIEVEFRDNDRGVSLAVKDNGRGFDADRRRTYPSMGLLSMRERARLIGSALEIHSSAGKGTTIRIVVPGRV